VGLHAVGVRLDELRTLAGAGPRDRVAQHLQQRGGVVAVHALTRDAVADALVGDRRGGGLAGQRDGDGVLVVLHEEDDRGLEDGREVERLVEVALAGAAVPAQRHHDRALAAQPRRVSDPDGVRELGGERRRLRGDMVGRRVVAGVPVALEQGEHLDRVDAARDDRRGVAVGREQPVALLEHLGRGDLAGLLPVGGRVDGEPALADERVRLVVEPSRGDQALQRAQQRVRGRHLPAVGRDRPPGGVDELHRIVRRQQVTWLTCHAKILVLVAIRFQCAGKQETL